MTSTVYVPVAKAICADEAALAVLGARNVHLGRIDPDARDVPVQFDCDSTQERADIGHYLLNA